MTLCIASACRYRDKSAYVLCSDTRSLSSSRDWGLSISCEDACKARSVDKFDTLVAGNPSEADILLADCIPTVRKYAALTAGDDSDIYTSEFQLGLRKAAQLHLNRLQDHLVATNSPFTGIEEFLQRGKAALPDAQYRDLWFEIKSQTLDCEVLVAGFHGEDAIIMKIDAKGRTQWIDGYAVIGTGSAEALAFFAQNEFDETEIQVEDCLLRVIEALDFASTSNNTVGHLSRFEVHIHGE